MVVKLNPKARREWGWLPWWAAVGWWLSPGGEVVQVRDDGTVEPLQGPLPFRRSVAADPTAGRSA